MLPLIPIAISLATKFAPMLLGKLFGNKVEDTAKKVIDIANTVSGGGIAPENLQAYFESNSKAALDFQKAANDLTSKLYEEDTKRLGMVNLTMQSESRSESWIQRSWRPINGLLFGSTIWCDYFLAPLVIAIAKVDLTLQHVPMEVYLLWSTILGVTAWTRGSEKIAKIKNGLSNIL